MSKYSTASSLLADGVIFFAGALVALLLLWSLYSFSNPLALSRPSSTAGDEPDLLYDPPDPTFYDDPALRYDISISPAAPCPDWDEKRRHWLLLHPTFAAGAADRVFMVTGSQPGPCLSPVGDHLLLRLFKNKVDYCRIHGYDVYYNNALLEPKMFTFWAKYPVVRAAMLAHPESEWIWWVDSDAAITDMDFRLPLRRYRRHNLVVHGWPALARKSWTGVNAGVFLIRNCQWSLDLIDKWAGMGPSSPNYTNWGPAQQKAFPDKLLPDSDDQTGLLYLMLKGEHKWRSKIYLENEYYFQGYWEEIVGRLQNISDEYGEMEREKEALRRRHAEKVGPGYGVRMEEELTLRGVGFGKEGWRRPFITHFTGCQPCSGNHNAVYSDEACSVGMSVALNFADNQVLRNFGFVHPDLLDSSLVIPIPFDFPAHQPPGD